MSLLDLISGIFGLLVGGAGITLVVIRLRANIIEKRKEAQYKRCKNCGSILSEWFVSDSGRMRCYSCGTVSEYYSHFRESRGCSSVG